ncbi:hypothetical protein A7E78_01200 [Syntrophotalea acetylenivorans]|uniref:TonB-dependent receptor plug domain-containing protein n=2 Tax=Syntrophotalea acetylenivorans TaxID=1842532 RepID=A0A1L3GKX1_9BACT|nr:hypothetical protein A7E78_01200 [Syntrophotalea acetylenivorans]
MTGQGSIIQSETLEKLPLRNNSINEALTILPGIQFSETANISTQGGEILPPQVSISGGKVFENNFTIDGISNNSLLDPNGKTPLDSPNDLAGHAQEMFLDASLADKITVYDSNVSARYGNFKGGVVDAETINPLPWFSSKLFYRTTRDEWTSFHLDPEKEEAFLSSTDHREQPKFRKHHYGFDFHIPLTPRLLTVSGYRQLYSRIPLSQEGKSKTQERREENFLFKSLFQPTLSIDLDFLWTYTPYHGTYFKDGYRDSDYTLYGGGHLFSVGCHTRVPIATLDTQVAYRTSENSREAPTHLTQTELSKNIWEREGFYGDLKKTQQSFQFKFDLSFLPISLGPTNHVLNTGIDTQHVEGRFERSETSYLYTYLLNDNPFSTKDDYPNRKVYEESDAKASLRQYGFYLENIITWGRLEFRPGMRVDYDDYMHNLNLAPRMAMAVDVFSNRQTLLIGGYNRYYANTLLAYKLREGIEDEYFEQLIADEWTFWKGHNTDTQFSELNTPYADEYVLGLEQRLFGGKMVAKYIQRKGREEFGKTFEKEEDGIYYNTLNNNGRSQHESYSLSWERHWRNHYLSTNVTYQETDSSNESYDDLVEEEDPLVSFQGKLTSKSELPRKDFNRPWVANITYIGKFPYGLTFSTIAKYRGGYKAIQNSYKKNPDVTLPDGTNPYIYEEVKKGGAVIISCRVDWEKRLYQNHSMILSLEVNNLLNKKTSVGDTDDYEIGRQVWAGMEYRF